MPALLERRPRPGVEQWINPRNGLTVIRLHYSCDPKKRTEEWKAQTAANMHPRTWRREYEIDWASPEGEPVVPEYREETHCRDFAWDTTLRLLRFWDFGFVSPVCLFAQLTVFGQLRVRRELCPFNTPLDQLLDAVESITLELGGTDALLTQRDAWDVGGRERVEGPTPTDAFDAGDPAGRNHTDLGSSADVLSAHGIILHTTRPGTEVSYANLRQRCLRAVMDPGSGAPVPAFLIHPDCPNLRAALAGAFYLEPLPPHKPHKSHPEKDLIDALRYGEDNLRLLAGSQTAERLRRAASADIRELRSAPTPDDTWAARQRRLWMQLVGGDPRESILR
jgi:hypothetical protein